MSNSLEHSTSCYLIQNRVWKERAHYKSNFEESPSNCTLNFSMSTASPHRKSCRVPPIKFPFLLIHISIISIALSNLTLPSYRLWHVLPQYFPRFTTDFDISNGTVVSDSASLFLSPADPEAGKTQSPPLPSAMVPCVWSLGLLLPLGVFVPQVASRAALREAS